MTPDPAMTKPVSRRRVLRWLGGVFLVGWLLSFPQFGLESPDRALTSPVMPVVSGVRSLNGEYGMALVGFGVTIFAVASTIFSIRRSKLIWLACLAIGLYWLWTYSLLAIPF